MIMIGVCMVGGIMIVDAWGVGGIMIVDAWGGGHHDGVCYGGLGVG